jgi:hypothetical protein
LTKIEQNHFEFEKMDNITKYLTGMKSKYEARSNGGCHGDDANSSVKGIGDDNACSSGSDDARGNVHNSENN